MDGDGFHDRNSRYSYLVACAVARRIEADPTLIEAGRAHLDRFSRDDPSESAGVRLWTALLDEGAAAVAARLVERTARADYARQTAPSFGALPPRLRTELLRRARSPLPPA